MNVRALDPISYRIKKESILQHARHVFATRGLAETSLNDIAHACHMQKASLYHYFSGKQQILQELLDMERERWWAARPTDFDSGTDLRSTLMLVGSTFLKDLEDPCRQEFFKIIYFESHKYPAILKALKDSPTHNRRGFYAIFRKHLKDKLSATQIAMFTTQFMGALIHFASLSRLRGEDICYEHFDDTSYVEQLVNIFARAIA